MSRLSIASIFLILGMAKGSSYEWKGIFYTPEAEYTWQAQKVDGSYADPTMTIAVIPAASATASILTDVSGTGASAMSGTCEDVQSGGTLTAAADKCYRLVFDQSRLDSTFKVDTSQTSAVAFFCQHFPTEFEATAHYFKDTSGVDIEPVSQEPEPGDGHSHGHGGGSGEAYFDSFCVCQAKKQGWVLDCTNQSMIQTAVDSLDADTACNSSGAPQTCIDNYYIMQAHHDHCLHDQLPTGIEKKLHDYEHYYTDCFVKRQYNPQLSNCPTVDCNDANAMTSAIQTLSASCTTTAACADSTCSAAIKTVLMVHDVCAEDQLPNNLETALHDHEEPCEAQLCNSAMAAFNPYDDPCSVEVSAARTQEVFSVNVLVLCFALLCFKLL